MDNNDRTVGPEPSVGQIRSFGDAGPMYEIMSVHERPTGAQVHIRLVHSGEELDYPWAEAASDPMVP